MLLGGVPRRSQKGRAGGERRDLTSACAGLRPGGAGGRAAGFTLIELLTVMAIIGILVTITAINVSKTDRNIYSGVNVVASALGSARTQAISTTSVVRVNLVSGALGFSTNSSCSAASGWTALPALAATAVLPSDLTLTSGTLTTDPVNSSKTLLTCFTARGLATQVATLTLTDTNSRTATVNVYITGAVQ